MIAQKLSILAIALVASSFPSSFGEECSNTSFPTTMKGSLTLATFKSSNLFPKHNDFAVDFELGRAYMTPISNDSGIDFIFMNLTEQTIYKKYVDGSCRKMRPDIGPAFPSGVPKGLHRVEFEEGVSETCTRQTGADFVMYKLVYETGWRPKAVAYTQDSFHAGLSCAIVWTFDSVRVGVPIKIPNPNIDDCTD